MRTKGSKNKKTIIREEVADKVAKQISNKMVVKEIMNCKEKQSIKDKLTIEELLYLYRFSFICREDVRCYLEDNYNFRKRKSLMELLGIKSNNE